MSHFTVQTNEDGTIAQILRDGHPYGEGVKLEPPHQIVSTYFKIAARNLAAMQGTQESELLRSYGLQAFLMSLTGVEAFTNVFFQLVARELNKPDLLAKVNKASGSLIERLRVCLTLAFDQPLPAQDALLERIGQLYRLRNQIVHPRWEPVSATVSGITLLDMTHNFQATFEERAFCEEAYWWCVKLVAEISRARGNTVIEGHCFFWAGIYGLTDETLADKLGSSSSAEGGQD